MVKPHRVPESVFDVEFKLFDIMSMKQFVIVMVTAGFAVMFYFLLDKITVPFVKWLVVLTVVIVGLIVAFLKLQGEPFEVYVTNFILALVSPQRRVWSKTSELPEYLKDNPKASTQQVTELAEKAQKAASPAFNEETIQAITQAKEPVQPATELDVIEKQYLEGKLPMFGAVKKAEQPVQKQTPLPQTQVPQATQTTVSTQPHISGPPVTTPVQLMPPPQPPTTLDTVPTQPAPTPTPVREPQQPTAAAQLQQYQTAQQQMNITEQAVSVESLNNSAATVPQAAMRPNILSGEVYSSDNKPLTTAIINIRQENGPITRALTSNALGQFVSSDPLQNGKYVIELIKPGYKFPKYKIECRGDLIPSKRYLGQQG